MPGKRPVKRGSFGSHFDELVKHFPHDAPLKDGELKHRPKSSSGDGDIHDKLFESAWRHTRDGQRPA